MTDREKAIVMAYTGKVMLVANKLDIFFKYIKKICGRPIWRHELADEEVLDEIKEKSKSDFIKLCIETTEAEPIRHGRWIGAYDDLTCSCCYQRWNIWRTGDANDCGYWERNPRYCPNCGAKMDEEVN